MTNNLRYLGLDVHAETIAAAIAEPDGEVRILGVIPNRADAVAKLMRKLGPRERPRACYEAGPCGYVLYWQLVRLGDCRCSPGAPRHHRGAAMSARHSTNQRGHDRQ